MRTSWEDELREFRKQHLLEITKHRRRVGEAQRVRRVLAVLLLLLTLLTVWHVFVIIRGGG